MTDRVVHHSPGSEGKESRTRRRTAQLAIAAATAALLAAGTVAPASAAPAAPGNPAGDGPYEATWDSVNQHAASPDWFKDAKFGVYWHWGAFTTPEYGFEWYPRQMQFEGDDINRHHRDTYGDPKDSGVNGFGFEKFLTGGKDRQGNDVKFAPKLAAEGGKFDPKAWIDLIEDSGAQFAGPVAEHHDGFSMWDSEVNEWNSADLGPELDLMNIFADEIKSRDMKFLVAMHHALNYNGYYSGAAAQPTDSLKKLYGQLPRDVEDQLWYDKLREVVDQSEPDIVWQDFGLGASIRDTGFAGICSFINGEQRCEVDEQQRLNYLSYYFNHAEARDKEVVSTFKHYDKGLSNLSSVEDYERGGPGDIVYPYWLTDDSVSSSSWSYTKGMGYYSPTQMIHSLLDRVSKNGSMLLNISPRADGSIPDEQQNVLKKLGAYLERNGDAVYSTRAWDVFGEGPTRMGGGSFSAPTAGTAADVRYTVANDDSKLYATVLGWPGDNGVVSLSTLGSNRTNLSGLTSVNLFGAESGQRIPLKWSQSGDALRVTMPASAPAAEEAYVIELSFPQGVPAPAGDNYVSFDEGPAGSAGVSLPIGDHPGRFLDERGFDAATVASLRVGKNVQITTFESDDLTGTGTVYRAGASVTPTKSIGSVRVDAVISGTFSVSSDVSGLRWSVADGAPSGATVTQQAATIGAPQQWRFDPTSDGFVRITNVATGLALESVSTDAGSSLQAKTANAASTSQQWKPSLNGGSWVLQNRANASLAVDSGGAVQPGSPLKQWTNNGDVNLRFTLTSVEEEALEGSYTVASQVNGLTWDAGIAPASGAVVSQNTAQATSSQQWTFEKSDSGYVRIKNGASELVIESVSADGGAAVALRSSTANTRQEWKPLRRGGAWVFENRATPSLVLDSGGSVAAGSPLKQWPNNNNSENFRFTLTKVVPATPGVDVTTTVTTRCVAGKVTQLVTVRNADNVSADVTVAGAYGSKKLTVAAGKSASAAFSTRAASIPAGSVTTEALVSGQPAAVATPNVLSPAASCR